jgi:16S rRNA (guanine966-N2)-methyltransferase
VREALFSILGPVDGFRVLDLYAGSGALGIEALSRGAAHAVLVERARVALTALRGNLAQLGLEDSARVLGADVADTTGPIRRLGPYELILADPPYRYVATGRLATTLEPLIDGGDLLTEGGKLALEHAARDPAPALARLSVARTRIYGDTAITIYD